jgi:SAGA-associated factor 73
VYGTLQLALPSLQHQQQQQQQLAFQQQQQQQLGLIPQHSSPASAMSALYSAVLPQQQPLSSTDSSSAYCSLNGLQLQLGQLLQQAHPAGLQLQQQQQMLLLQAQQQQQAQSVLQLQPLAQHAPLLQLQPHTMQQQQQEVDSLSQLLQQQMQLQQSAVHLSQQQQQQQQQLQLAVLPQSVAQQQVVVGPLDLQPIDLQQQQHVLLTTFDAGSTGQEPQSQFMPYWQSL